MRADKDAHIVTETIAADATLYNLKIPGYNSPQTLFAAGMIRDW